MENSEDNYPLDEAVISVMQEVAKEFEVLQRRAAELNGMRHGALQTFVRQQKLKGDWDMAENGRELVRRAAPVEVQKQEG